MDCQTRSEFLSGLSDGGKYANLVAFYRHNSSADRIGIFDAELINALPSTCKWIAHNGAGYDQIDIAACQKRGTRPILTPYFDNPSVHPQASGSPTHLEP